MTTYFEFGYLFGGVEIFSYTDKNKAIIDANKKGFSYIVKRQEYCSYDGETISTLSLIAWGTIRLLNKENLLHALSDNPSAYQKALTDCDAKKKYVYLPHSVDRYIDADTFSGIKILPPKEIKQICHTRKKR